MKVLRPIEAVWDLLQQSGAPVELRSGDLVVRAADLRRRRDDPGDPERGPEVEVLAHVAGGQEGSGVVELEGHRLDFALLPRVHDPHPVGDGQGPGLHLLRDLDHAVREADRVEGGIDAQADLVLDRLDALVQEHEALRRTREGPGGPEHVQDVVAVADTGPEGLGMACERLSPLEPHLRAPPHQEQDQQSGEGRRSTHRQPVVPTGGLQIAPRCMGRHSLLVDHRWSTPSWSKKKIARS